MAKRKTVDAYIRQMNARCDALVDSGGCKHDCMGIGYCDAVIDANDLEEIDKARAKWQEEKWRFYPDG